MNYLRNIINIIYYLFFCMYKRWVYVHMCIYMYIFQLLWKQYSRQLMYYMLYEMYIAFSWINHIVLEPVIWFILFKCMEWLFLDSLDMCNILYFHLEMPWFGFRVTHRTYIFAWHSSLNKKKKIIHWAAHKIFRKCSRKSSRLWDAHNLFWNHVNVIWLTLMLVLIFRSSLAYSCL